jgi:hypothetical protein
MLAAAHSRKQVRRYDQSGGLAILMFSYESWVSRTFPRGQGAVGTMDRHGARLRPCSSRHAEARSFLRGRNHSPCDMVNLG